MRQPPAPRRGSVVIYVDDHDPAFRRAVALGPMLVDPQTDQDWVPLIQPDGTVVLTGSHLIVDVSPAGTPSPLRVEDPAGPVGVLTRALGRLVAALTGLAEQDHPDAVIVASVLIDFAQAAAPVEQALRLLAETNLDGGLVVVLNWLSYARDAHNAGSLTDALSGVLIADSTLNRMLIEHP